MRRFLVLPFVVLLVLAVTLLAQALVPQALALTTSAVAAQTTAPATSTAPVTLDAPAVAAAPAKDSGGQSLVQLYKAVNSSVVEVVNLAQASRYSSLPVEQALGSGFVWDTNGYIVTNDHVVAGADALQVVFADGSRVEAKLVGTDPSADLAVVKVDASAATLGSVALQPVKQADMAQVEVGQNVVAIGNPYGFQGTLTVGIVSGLGRTIDSQTQYSIPNSIQTDAAINPGNSGGPLLNLAGEVIGVNDQIESASGSNSGVGFAIPISIVQRVVPALIKDGIYQHAYLGVSMDTYNPMWSGELGLPANAKGVYVESVVQSAPAQQAGLRGGSTDSNVLLTVSMRGPQYLQKGGDLITAIDGQPVKTMDQLMTYLSEKTSPGQTVQLTVLRGTKTVTVKVKLGMQPANTRLSQTTG